MHKNRMLLRLLAGEVVSIGNRKLRLYEGGDDIEMVDGHMGTVADGHFWLGTEVVVQKPGCEPSRRYVGAALSFEAVLELCATV